MGALPPFAVCGRVALAAWLFRLGALAAGASVVLVAPLAWRAVSVVLTALAVIGVGAVAMSLLMGFSHFFRLPLTWSLALAGACEALALIPVVAGAPQMWQMLWWLIIWPPVAALGAGLLSEVREQEDGYIR